MRADPSPHPERPAADASAPTVLRPDGDGVRRAAERLRSGRPVAIPTETVYGLAVRAADPAAVRRLFVLKGRPADHPLIVHLPDADAAGAWTAGDDPRLRRLAERFWPGPLTLIRPRAAGVPDAVAGGHPTIAVRVPGHPLARAVLEATGEALAAPSANRFGRISPTRAEHVVAEFPDADLWILDGGPCPVGLESTIVDLSGPRPVVLRPGAISAHDLAEALGEPVAEGGTGRADPSDADPGVAAPGTLASHYAPEVTVVLVPTASLARWVAERPDAALLLRGGERPAGHAGAFRRAPLDPDGYGRALYHALRALDATAPPLLLVERPPDGPAWRAVHDRLAKAAAPRERSPHRRTPRPDPRQESA